MTSLSSLDYSDCLRNSLCLSLAQTAAAPLERAKLVMQSEWALQQGGVIRGMPFQKLGPTLKRLHNVEGPAMLWRGNMMNFARALPSSVVVWSRVGTGNDASFLQHQQQQQLMKNPYRLQRDGFPLWYLGALGRSTFFSVLFLCLIYPLELCRTALAVDCVTAPNERYLKVGVRKFNSGYISCIRNIVSRGRPGGWALYSGFGTAALALTVYRAVHLGLESAFNKSSSTHKNSSSSSSSFTADFCRSYLICTFAGFAAYPLDTISKWCVVEIALARRTPLVVDTKNVVEPNRQQQQHYVQPSPSQLGRQAYRIGGMRLLMSGSLVNCLKNAVVMAFLNLGMVSGRAQTVHY